MIWHEVKDMQSIKLWFVIVSNQYSLQILKYFKNQMGEEIWKNYTDHFPKLEDFPKRE